MLSSEFINSLSEEEMGLLLYFINVANRPFSHNIPFEINDLKWFRKDILTQKLLDSFNSIREEGHPTFVSLMEKFGVKVDIKKEEPKKIEEPITDKKENEPSVSNDVIPPTEEVKPNPEITSSIENK